MSIKGEQRIPAVQYEKQTEEGFFECKESFYSRRIREENGRKSLILTAGSYGNSDEKKPFWQEEKQEISWEEKPDSYALEISEKGIYLESYTERGFFYGVRTLEKWDKQYKGRLPFVKLLDWADVAVRCDYLEFRNFYPKLDHVMEYLEDMADRHINGILVEMEDKRPFLNPELQKLQNKKTGFTREEINRLREKAKELYIEWIPLQQSFGHLEYVLKYPEYENLRELPESAGELCPLKPGSIELAKKLLEDMAQLFPDSHYLHLGCDEVWSLLHCKQCKNSGMTAAEIFIQYVNQLIDFVCSLGKIPLFWHDMLIHGTVEELKKLDKRAVVVVWMYDGNDLEIRASSFIEKLRAAGLTVWGACAVRCWDKSGFQNYPVLKNRKTNVIQWSKVCKKYHLEGMVNTNWSAYSALAYPYGIYETSIYPASFAAEKCWNYNSKEDDFLGKYLRFYHEINPEKILEKGFQFEDYYEIAAELKNQSEKETIVWNEREADWYQVIGEYEEATQGDFPAVLQMFRIAKFPERSEEWDSMKQRYFSTFERLKNLRPKMKKVLGKYMDFEPSEVYLYGKYYLWELYEKEILHMAKMAEREDFYPILTRREEDIYDENV